MESQRFMKGRSFSLSRQWTPSWLQGGEGTASCTHTHRQTRAVETACILLCDSTCGTELDDRSEEAMREQYVMAAEP